MHEKLLERINRKDWWHVPPEDPLAYQTRGKFLASTFREAEFWGRPLDEPQHVEISNPLIGDEATIELELFGKRIASEEMTVAARHKLDERLKKEALKRGYDSIVLLTPKGFDEYTRLGKSPHSIELNVFLNEG